MDVDQAWRDIVAGNIDNFRAGSRLYMFGDLSNPVVFYGYVANRIDPVFGVDNVAALKHKVIRCLPAKHRGRKRKQQRNPD